MPPIALNAWKAWPRRIVAEWIAVSCLATLLALVLVWSGASARLDNIIYDATLRIAPRPPDPRIIIVAIDDRALAEVGAWPWSRRTHAAIVDRLTAADARVVAYDVLFVEPSAEPGADEALAAALGASGRVCLPVLIETPGRNGAAYQLSPPLPALAAGAAGLGHVDLDYDPDGVSRRAALTETAGGRALPHLMACTVKPAKSPLPSGGDLVRGQTALIPYGGGPGRFPVVSAASVLQGEIPAAFFAGRTVLVGATASGLHDRHSTPVSTRNEAMAGVEVQANLLEGLLTGDFIRPVPPWVHAAVTLALVWTFMASLLWLSPRRNLVVGFAILAGAVGLAVGLLLSVRVWLPPSPAALTVLLVFPLWGWRRLEATSAYMVDELERFAREPDVLAPSETQSAAGDAIARQINLMRHAVQRARTLRAYAAAAAAQREQMIAFLSHDMRSPQASILALLALPDTPPGLAQRIGGYARRTLSLADNLVHLAKAESGVLTREVLDLADLVTEAVDEAWPLAKRSQVNLRTVGADASCLVSGDRSLLSRALMNLLDNAVKFSPPGGAVTVTLEPATREGGPEVRLSIADEGPGIAPEQRAGLFERFERVPGSHAPGIGLGLALVQEVVRRHAGTLAYSDAGPGAIFVLTLPLGDEA